MKNFTSLSPAQLLEVLVGDIMTKGRPEPEAFDYWNNLGDLSGRISQEQKFDQVIRILEMKAPSKPLAAMESCGLLAFCMPLCFPIKKGLARRDLKSVIERFDKCGGQLPVRINTFLFPFDREKARETLVQADFDPEVVELMISALDDMEDFVLIKDRDRLKRFVYRKGKDYYCYIDSLAEQLNLALDFPEYKRLSKKYLMEEIERNHEVIFPQDLAIKAQDLAAVGIEMGEEAEEMMGMLAEHCHLKPYDNQPRILLKQAKALKNSKLKRFFRNVRWIK